MVRSVLFRPLESCMALTRYRSGEVAVPFWELPAAALRAVLREGYTRLDLRRDVLAGLVVGVVALPLAMALAVGVGAAPQHGLYTAVVAGLVIALLGGSRLQVSGPTAAFIVVLAPIYSKFGLAGLLVSGLLGGVILVGMAVARLGKLVQFIPDPVTTGFTAGIATVIATLQIKDLLGLSLPHLPSEFVERVIAMAQAYRSVSPSETLIGFATLAVLLVLPRFTKRIPAPLVALPLAAFLALALGHWVDGFHVETIRDRFSTLIDGEVVRGIPQLPPLPGLPWNFPGPHGEPLQFSRRVIRELLTGAFAIAMLGAIESLLSAVVADGMAQTRHDPDAELLAQGIGNIVAPFFGGIPATGAIARTATNYRSGARSPIAAAVHALAVLVSVLALAPFLGYLPMASLAALLLLVAWNMSDLKHFVHMLRIAPRSDVAVLLICFSLTVLFDMVVGVAVGMVLASLLFMRRMAEVTHAEMVVGPHHSVPGPLPEGVSLYEISGPLFFGAAQKAMGALTVVTNRPGAVIFLMDGVNAMDATGLVALESVIERLRKNNGLAILSGVRDQPRSLLRKAHWETRPGVIICADASEAFAQATKYVASIAKP